MKAAITERCREKKQKREQSEIETEMSQTRFGFCEKAAEEMSHLFTNWPINSDQRKMFEPKRSIVLLEIIEYIIRFKCIIKFSIKYNLGSTWVSLLKE